MSDSQPEATAAKSKILSKTNAVLFVAGIFLGAVLVVGISAFTLSQVNPPSAVATDTQSQDKDGVLAACREYVVVAGKSIYDPESVDPSYVTASKLTTNGTLKQALVDLGTFEWPEGEVSSEEAENLSQQLEEKSTAVYDFCLNAGAYSNEDYQKFMDMIVQDLQASEVTP